MSGVGKPSTIRIAITSGVKSDPFSQFSCPFLDAPPAAPQPQVSGACHRLRWRATIESKAGACRRDSHARKWRCDFG